MGFALGCVELAVNAVHAQNQPVTARELEIQQAYERTFGVSPQALEARAKAKKEFDDRVRALRDKVREKGNAIMHASPAAPNTEAARRRFTEFLDARRAMLKEFNVPALALPTDVPLVTPTPTASPTPTPNAAPGTLLERLEHYQETSESLEVYVQAYLAQSPFIAELGNPDLTAPERMYLQVALWHQIALDLTAIDHTKQRPNAPPVGYRPFEQRGPVRSSRALALSHLATFEALNAVAPRYRGYFDDNPLHPAAPLTQFPGVPATVNESSVSVAMAMTQASFEVLAALYPSKLLFLKEIRNVVAASIVDTPEKRAAGMALGSAVAARVLKDRAMDKADLLDPGAEDFAKLPASQWHPDPLNPGDASGIAYGAYWSLVTPFVLEQANQFRPKNAPPDLNSAAFKAAYDDVKIKGGDFYANPTLAPVGERASTDTNRTGWDRSKPDFEAVGTETFIGKFWAYDGTFYLCAPPRLYNMIASSLAYRERPITDALDYARYLALVNLALADAGIGAWEAKYFYLYPRPVTGIRTAIKDLPFTTAADRRWTPLGAQVTNSDTQNFTPNFPSYPSGHAVFGGAVFQVLRRVYGVTPRLDPRKPPGVGNEETALPFQFLSDEYNGLNSDANPDPSRPNPRPRLPQDFPSLAKAEWDNGRSRVFLGIHWSFDAIEGIIQGNEIGDYVFKHALNRLDAAPTPTPTPTP